MTKERNWSALNSSSEKDAVDDDAASSDTGDVDGWKGEKERPPRKLRRTSDEENIDCDTDTSDGDDPSLEGRNSCASCVRCA